MAAGAAILFTACNVKDPIYDALPRYGNVTVLTDWSGTGSGVDIPSSWIATYGGGNITIDSDIYTFPEILEAGNYTFYFYNEPGHIAIDGTVATVEASGDDIHPLPDWFFTYRLDTVVTAGVHHEFPVPMRQQVRELTIIIEPTGSAGDRIESISASLSGVAGSLDFSGDLHGTPSSVALDFSKITSGDDDGNWSVTVRLLGVTGDEQILTGTVTYTDGLPEDMPLESSLTSSLADFNEDKATPLTLRGDMVETPVSPGFTAVISEWEEVIAVGDGTVDMLSVYLSGAGLYADLLEADPNGANVARLRILGGTLTGADLTTINSRMPNLVELDIRGTTFPNNIMPQSAFANNTMIRKIILPETLTTIGFSAFILCTSLGSVELPESLTTISEYAFGACSSLISIVIPGNVKTIGYGAFLQCPGLRSVTLTEGLEVIGDSAFHYCTSLGSVVLPESLTAIGEYAFYECGFKSVTVPGNITEIKTGTFKRCFSLRSVVLPENLRTIGTEAFQSCNSLTSVTCLPVTPPTMTNHAFNEISPGLVVMVPSESVDTYKAAPEWRTLAPRITAIP